MINEFSYEFVNDTYRVVELKSLFERGKEIVFGYYSVNESDSHDKELIELANFSSSCNIDLEFVIDGKKNFKKEERKSDSPYSII